MFCCLQSRAVRSVYARPRPRIRPFAYVNPRLAVLTRQIISALLSRCRVFTLNKIGVDVCVAILQRALRLHTADIIALDDAEVTPPQIDDDLLRFLATACDGDARVALSSLELALAATSASSAISREDLMAGLRKAHLLYDRAGDSHFDTISALHVRRSPVRVVASPAHASGGLLR